MRKISTRHLIASSTHDEGLSWRSTRPLFLIHIVGYGSFLMIKGLEGTHKRYFDQPRMENV